MPVEPTATTTPDAGVDPAIEAILPTEVAGHLTRMCATGFQVDWTSDAGDIPYTGVYDARTRTEWIYGNTYEEYVRLTDDAGPGDYVSCEVPCFDEAYEYWCRAVEASRNSRVLARRIRAAVLEHDGVTVRAAARELRDLALVIERDSDAYTMLTGVAGRLEEIYEQDEG